MERELKHVYEIEAKMEEESAQILVKIEAKVQGESTQLLNQIFGKRLETIWKIEANIQREAWTVIAKIDTIMLRNWLNEASKFQE